MKSFIKYFLSLILIGIYGTVAYSQATLLPNAKQAFMDANGRPLTAGTVTFYVPNTSTPKTTWQNAEQTIFNTNPVILDAAGRAIIYGSGSYRQVVRDRLGNIVWDQVTSSTGTSGGGGGGTTDTTLVGTVLMWSGFTAPTNYVFAYGQEVSRLSFPGYLTVVTQTLIVSCTSGSATLTGLSDTSQLPVNAKIESVCAPTGSFIISKTGTTVTMNVVSVASTTASTVFFPYGNGDGVTTFNVPDFRGRVTAGRDNMGGVTAARLTATYFGVTGAAIGATGGDESQTLTVAQMPSHDHGGLTGVQTTTTTARTYFSGGVVTAGGATPSVSQISGSAGPGQIDALVSNHQHSITAQGGGTPHPNVQPTITLNYIVKILPTS